MNYPKQGDTFSFSRKFTREDILDFAGISHDHGSHHVSGKRLIAHGLLVATLPTKLGGDLNFIGSEMHFNFLKPVYEGETVTCTGKAEKITSQSKRIKCLFSFVCHNEKNECVLTGTSSGMIRKDDNQATDNEQ